MNTAKKILSRRHSPLIVSLYTGWFKRYLLYWHIGITPQPSLSYNIKDTSIDLKLRDVLKQILLRHADNFSPRERAIITTLPYTIPSIYLEGFNDLFQNGLSETKGREPRFILTANAFETNESFKIRTAIYTNRKVPYIVLQHGCNYGTNKDTTVEELTCDYFLSWGWSVRNNQKYIPLAIQKFSKSSFPKPSQNGKLLILMSLRKHPHQLYNVYGEFYKIVRAQQYFLSTLSSNALTNVNLRLHSASEYLSFNEKDVALEILKPNQIEEPSTHLFKSLRNARIAVFTADCTGMLECLCYNYPCVVYTQNLDHVLDSVIHYYELLIEAKILFLNSVDASRHINSIFDNVNLWWTSARTQYAREAFVSANVRYKSNWSKAAAKSINAILNH